MFFIYLKKESLSLDLCRHVQPAIVAIEKYDGN